MRFTKLKTVQDELEIKMKTKFTQLKKSAEKIDGPSPNEDANDNISKDSEEHQVETTIARLKAEKQQVQVKEMRDLKQQLKNSISKQEYEAMKSENDQLKFDLLD
ncbi:hypothetical protein RFI_01152, partial [Reticulomyxa filosa]